MAIYARFGGTVDSIRYATVADVKRKDKLDNEAKWSLGNRSWVVIEGDEVPESISHLAYLRADHGLQEISKALTGQEWECPYCLTMYVEQGDNNRCANADCHKEHRRVEQRMKKERGW